MKTSLTPFEFVLIGILGFVAVESTSNADTLAPLAPLPQILTNDLDLRGMCERYPGSCNSAPIVVVPATPVNLLPRANTTCISGMLYKEVPANPHEYPTWVLVTTSTGGNIACK